MRSSSEWKLMTTSLPPGFRTCGRRFQQRLQVVQFAVYEDSESLKSSWSLDESFCSAWIH